MNRDRARRVGSLVKPAKFASAALLALVWAWPGSAAAADLTCDRVQAETITVDGMIDDWSGFRGRRIGKKAADRGLSVRCAYDSAHLYVVLIASDDQIIRGAKGDASREDSLRLSVKAPGGKSVTVTVFPGTRGFKPKVVGARKGIDVADSLQEGGFSAEISIRLKKIPKWTRTLPALSAKVRFGDADRPGKGKAVSRVSGRLRLQFSDADAVFKSFLRATGLKRGQIRYDVLRDVNMGDGAERVVAGGDVIGVLGENFIFMRLPVADPADVLKVRVVNFSGKGRAQILAHFRQHGGGSRDVVAVWNIDSSRRFQRLFAVEVRKEHEGKLLENKWSLVRAGALRAKPAKTKKRGYDLVVEATEAVGFTSSNYLETRSVDEDPILLPWKADDSKVYYFDGDDFAGSEAMDEKKRAKRKKAAEKKAAKKRRR